MRPDRAASRRRRSHETPSGAAAAAPGIITAVSEHLRSAPGSGEWLSVLGSRFKIKAAELQLHFAISHRTKHDGWVSFLPGDVATELTHPDEALTYDEVTSFVEFWDLGEDGRAVLTRAPAHVQHYVFENFDPGGAVAKPGKLLTAYVRSVERQGCKPIVE